MNQKKKKKSRYTNNNEIVYYIKWFNYDLKMWKFISNDRLFPLLKSSVKNGNSFKQKMIHKSSMMTHYWHDGRE